MIHETWLAAVRTAGVRTAIEDIYADISRAIAERAPRCDASGRCCHFEAWGHRLYVTGLEAAYLIAHLPEHRAAQPSASERTQPRTLSLPQVHAAKVRGDCPFLDGTLCTVHEIKPVGCRVYYCEPGTEGWQQDLTETMLARLRTLHDGAGVAYRYGEWREMLARFAANAVE